MRICCLHQTQVRFLARRDFNYKEQIYILIHYSGKEINMAIPRRMCIFLSILLIVTIFILIFTQRLNHDYSNRFIHLLRNFYSNDKATRVGLGTFRNQVNSDNHIVCFIF